jgi:hypothetical protein
MKKTWFLLFAMILSSGCGVSMTDAPDPLATPIPTPSPFITFTPSPTFVVTVSPAPSLTPTFPPYPGEPFTIVFLRSGNVWMAEIGERVMERQLTFESMRVISFDVSPDETHIAYIPYQLEPLNSLVKMVEIASGETRVILGENDLFSEVSVVWLDDTRIAYKSQESLVPTFTTGQVDNPTTYIVYDLSTGRRIETTPFDLIVPSPDGRFWLTCIGHVEGCRSFSLHHLESGQEYPIGKFLKWVTFARWAPDSKHMVFHTVDSPDDCTGQIVLINAETLEERLVAPDDKDAWDAEVSPSGEFLVYQQTDIVDAGICQESQLHYWLMDMNSFEAERIPAEFEKHILNVSWAPDGQRLIFFYGSYAGREHDLWSMNLDGTDLRPMLPNVEEFKILSSGP